MSIITSGGGMDITHPAESAGDAALLAAAGGGRDMEAARAAARDLLNQPTAWTPKADAAFQAASRALSTSVFDPAVSDGDAKHVLDALAPLSTREWLGVVRKMQQSKTADGDLFSRFAKRGLADSAPLVERFLRQVLDKFGARDASGAVSIPTALLEALGKEIGAPGRYELSKLGAIKHDVSDTVLLGAQLVSCLFMR